MIFLVSGNKTLFGSSKYKEINFKEAMDILLPLKYCQLDTETRGLDCHTQDLLTIQLGNTKNQIVFDWKYLTIGNRKVIKEYLESDRVFIGHNIGFDLTFLYKQNIWPKYIYDTMIAEQLIYLGYPRALSAEIYNNIGIDFYEPVTNNMNNITSYELSYSLKATAKRRLGIDIDKSVRGKIINEGLTEEVVVYAGGDVQYLEDIRDKQLEELKNQNLLKACEFECTFVKVLSYTKYCGVHLDIEKWKAKMQKDQMVLNESISELNKWVVDWCSKNSVNNWEIRYPYLEGTTEKEIREITELLLKSKYERSPADDIDTPNGKVPAFKKKLKDSFIKIDIQGDLFNGFNTKPQCVINWSSSQQVIKFFEQLGINVDSFDKKTKKKKKSIEEKQIAPQADKFPIIPIFLKYQGAAKVVSTYGENWLKAINPKTGRIHLEMHSIGTDTSRVSSGGGPYKLNIQNLPNDATTRACFTAEKGNKWLSCDYTGQESAIIASVSKDRAMIEELSKPNGDIHSLVAYMSYPHLIPRDTKIEEIKQKYHHLRQEAKGIEFSINYGGDFNTIANNKGISLKEAQKIYDDFMKGFPGLRDYQEYCRKTVMRDGYILMNPILGHRAHIFDSKWLLGMQEKFKDSEFWEYYKEMRRDAPNCDTVQDVKKYFNRKSASEKQSINYRIQNRGACCFKLASIILFNYIIDHNYQNIVKLCVPAHDEWNIEVPEELEKEMADVLVKSMIKGGKPFCPNVFLGADIEIGDHWIH